MTDTSATRLPTGALIAIGMMLFALFFGAGNLIFPAALGQQAGESTAWAVLGFLVTGVGLPLAGVVAMGISGARDLQDLAGRVHPWFGLLFTVALYLTIGPLFAIPRTGSVAFELGPAHWLAEDARRPWELAFLAAFFAIALWLSLSPGKLVDRIGRVLTPLLLVSMAILIAATFLAPMGDPLPAEAHYAERPLLQGFLAGYETMDALAALVFGILVLQAVRRAGVTGSAAVARATFTAGIVAAGLLAVVYVCIARMGAQSTEVLGLREHGAQVLSGVAAHYYGGWGAALLGIMVLLACMTTAVGLIAACASYFERLFPRMGYRLLACLFAGMSFAVSSLGLSTILSAAVPVLVFLYPLTIVLVALAFLQHLFGWGAPLWRWVMGATLLASLLHALAGFGLLPAGLAGVLENHLPGHGAGMGWILPALLAAVIGWLAQRADRRDRA